jgi:peptidoglycan/LPS O-acetylase OafA/YrhL
VDFREAYDNGIYKDALTTVWMFGLGGAAYFLKSASRPAPAGVFAAAVAVATVWLVGISDSRFVGAWLERSDPGWAALLAGFIGAFVVIVAVAVACSAEREPRWSRTLGDLSYGIYLNHLLTAYLMLYAASLAGFSVFGRIGDVGFGVVAVAMSSAVAFVTLKAVEEPIDRLRQRIKAAMAPPAAPPASLAG